MQYKLLVAALFATLPLVASAQSNVTMYGVVDATFGAEDTGAPDGSKTTISSGNQSSSRFGFKGEEDLGNGLKAIFNLEGGYKVDTGAGDSDLFGRRAVVGLKGSFGTLTIGREYSPIAAIAGFSDINGQGFYGSNLSAFSGDRLTRRLSNSINYKSNKMSGLVGYAAYASGEKTTGASGDMMGAALTYTSGPFTIGGGYHKVERLATGDDTEFGVGASLKMGDIEFKTNYLVDDAEGASAQFKQLNIGASMGFGASTVFVNLQENTAGGGAKGNAFSIDYSYALSKRTNVYTGYAKMRNNTTANFGLNSSSGSVTPPSSALGSDPTVLNIGIRHKF